MVIRSSTSYARVTTRSTTLSRSSRSASARKPTRPRLTPSIGTPEARANSAPRSSVPSPPSTISSSQPSSTSGVASRDRLAPARAAAGRPPPPPAPAPRCRAQQPLDDEFGAADGGGPAGVGEQEDSTAAAGCRRQRGPSATARSTSAGSSSGAPAPQPQKVLDIPGRPRQRARRHAQHARDRVPRPARRPSGPLRRAVRAAHDAAAAEPFLAHLELRLDHQHQVGVGCGAAHEGGQHEPERDEGQVADDQVRPAPRRSSSSVNSRTFVRSLTVTRSSLCSDQASWP